MKTDNIATFEGGCTCGEVRYRLIRSPIIVHCCHCRWCQRETGTAFALNAMIESHCVELLKGKPERVDTPSNSGKGQDIIRCPSCHIAVWSHYAGAGDLPSFVRVGTLDKPTSGNVLYDGSDVFALDGDALASFRSGSIGFVLP